VFVRVFIRAAMASALTFLTVVGPISAATTSRDSVAQATQTSTAVTGRVLDPRGGALSGASVTIDGNSIHRTVRTDAKGAFSFNVPAGLYTLAVDRGGYQSGQSDIAVVAGTPLTVNVSLTEADLSNLSVIGRTTSNANRAATFNTSSTASSSVGSDIIQARDLPDITEIGDQLPGVSIEGGSTAPNKSFVIRGLDVESRVTIEGHPVSSGVFGTYFTQYAASGIFQSIDVLKGAGLNGPTAGQSAVGTINLRTRDFTPQNSGSLKIGSDSYYGTVLQAFADVNFFNDRASLIVGRVVNGYNGPTKGTFANKLDFTDSPAIPAATLGSGALPAGGLINFNQDLSATSTIDAELFKLRYKLSSATSITLEALGLQARYDPQGGAYAQFEANATIAQCTNNKVPGSGAACTNTSTYSAPWLSPLIGQTNVPTYSFFPGSDVINNQPNFNAELRTTYKNDTILLRPYTAVINRLINGDGEVNTPGNNGGWFEVTNPANCTVQFTAASAANGGASGPCYAQNAANNTAAYVNNPQVSHTFPTTNVVPNCSVATPCFTTATAADNAQNYGYGTPFNQPELDKLSGYTFTYIHPVGDNIFNLSFDHFMDDTIKYSGDTTPPAPGCQLVIGAGAKNFNSATGQAIQPGCNTINNILPQTAINLPETVITQGDLSLTAQIKLRSNLELDFGNYFTFFKGQGQVENPAVLAQFANPANGTTSIQAPLSLVTHTSTYSHYDPHIGFAFRPSRDVSLRLTAGSSISPPFAQQISGPGNLAFGQTQDTFTVKNPDLLPEEVVTYDLGGDFRFKSGAVLSSDIFNTIVHNAWVTNTFVIPNFPGRTPQNGTFETTTVNAPEKRAQGVEVSLTNEPRLGLGYRVTSTFERSYFLEIPISIIALSGTTGTATFNGAQIPFIPYAKAYGELQYAGTKGFLFRIGANYEGNNNPNFYTPYVLFDASTRFNIGKGYMAQISGDNITNLNFGNNLAKAVFSQGIPSVAQFVNAQGQFAYTSINNGSIGPPFKTFRFTVSKNF
jgi:outer membrane receptor protein involved in Fe transport